MQKHYPMAEGQTEHVLPLAQFTRVGNTVYVSGHGAVGRDGAFVSDDFAEQMHYTMRMLQETLASAGAVLSQVVMVRAYVQRPEDIPLYNQVYREYFAAPYPSRTTIVNCLPPGLLFEIDCIASLEPR